MNKISSRSIVQLLSLLLLVFVTAAIILYRQGYYDISFIERPAPETEDSSSDAGPSETSAQIPQQTLPPETTQSGNLSGITNPGDVTETDTSQPQGENSVPASTAFLNARSDSQTYIKRGYSVNTEDYSASKHILTKLSLGVAPQNTFSLSKNTRTSEFFNDETDTLETVTTEYDRPVLELYMGMIFLDDGKTVGLLDDSGSLAMVGFEDIAFAYERDAYERPLFFTNGGYYYITKDLKLQWSNFNPAFGYPVRHDSLKGYNEARCGLYPFYVETTVQYIANYERMYKLEKQTQTIIEPEYAEEDVKLFGYMDAAGNVVIEPQYYFASNFGPEGLAVVANRDRVISIINTKGREIINPHGTIVRQKDRNNYNAIMGYYLPATDTAAEIGSFTFDHGLMRVRCEMRDYFDIGQIVGDYDMLITDDGKKFEMPEGYTLKAYSDGVLLLERDGRFGCMDYTGRWIAQPIYTYAEPFYEGLCVLGFRDGKKGMIDTSGNIVIPFSFDYISNVSSGRIAVYDAAIGWTVLEKLAK